MKNRVRIKICGITRADDALAAARAGADALGFVFHPDSPRYVTPDDAREIISALPPFITTVGVFVDEELEAVNRIARDTGLDAVQLHGTEPPEYCRGVEGRVIKALRVKDDSDIEAVGYYEVSAVLLDAFREGVPGGTGKTFDWTLAEKAVEESDRIILSGGLNPENVAEAVRRVRPYGVDVSSGVESGPGHKHHDLVREFIERARGAGE